MVPDRHFEWHTLKPYEPDSPANTRLRLRRLFVGFVVAAIVILGRAVHLELSGGEQFRQEAEAPIERSVPVAATRGKILSRDGQVLAFDQRTQGLAVAYRWLENPADEVWLSRQARMRLSRDQRRDRQRLAEAKQQVVAERQQLHRDLAAQCGVSVAQWEARRTSIQAGVSSLAERVNRRRVDRYRARTAENDAQRTQSWSAWLWDAAGELSEDLESPPAPVVVAEELDFHVMVDDVPAALAEKITREPDRFPGVRLVDVSRRAYPQGELAANVLGHLQTAKTVEAPGGERNSAEQRPTGMLGLERQYDGYLSGTPGIERISYDAAGRTIERRLLKAPRAGHDLTITLDARMQRAAEQLLDRSQRRPLDSTASTRDGGAVVVLDVHSGQLIAAASAPRFDPNIFAQGEARSLERVLDDPRSPLFDRVSRMELPPGSIFKIVTALAILESRPDAAREVVRCRGYLETPERERCAIFRHFGVGHGEMDLSSALVQSCNVYFYRSAGELGPLPILRWAQRSGCGASTGVDLPNEEPGQLPTTIDRKNEWTLADTRALAIGQSSLTVTPLQMARLIAAVANGGRLVQPHFAASDTGSTQQDSRPASPTDAAIKVIGCSDKTLRTLQEALRLVVADPSGTGYETVRLPTIAIAGKTGTAEAGGATEDHAWFAGYAPAERPRYAVVVALARAGSGSAAAGPIVKELVAALARGGYFDSDLRHTASDDR